MSEISPGLMVGWFGYVPVLARVGAALWEVLRGRREGVAGCGTVMLCMSFCVCMALKYCALSRIRVERSMKLL